MVNIGQFRGLLWRKIQEKKVEEVVLPGFHAEAPEHFVDLPSAKTLKEIDVKYPLIVPFAYAKIKWDEESGIVKYDLQEPQLSEEERKIFDKVGSSLIDLIQVGLSAVKDISEATKYLEEQIKKVFKSLNISLSPDQYTRMMYYIYRDFIGLNEAEPLLRDPWLEDIGCDGVNVPIYVVHRKYGSIKTNVVFNDLERLREYVIKLAERCGRYVSYAEPILDGTLPDGSRVNASLAGDVTTRGPTFSIRKFTERPFSPVDIIEVGTASPATMAYFWYVVENGVSLLIAGGVATGKTTFLNTICMFIPPEAKIVSIEDTRELRLTHEHWIPAVSRLGFGIPMSTGEKYGEITLFDLLKGSFRQNPDYVIVGEVRGKEAYVMFQGMSSGHPSFATFHAGSVDTVIKRLTTPPIELSASLVESLDVIIVMIHAKERGKSARRIKEVEEIKSVEQETLRAETYKVAEWDPRTDSYKLDLSGSLLLQKIAHNKGINFEDAVKEVEKREAILLWLVKNKIKDFEEVAKIINDFYKNPVKLFEKIGKIDLARETAELEKRMEKIKVETTGEEKTGEEKVVEKEREEVKEEVEGEEPDVYSIFGFKLIKEKVPAA